MARTFQVTFDAADPRALGDFWCEVLGYVRDAPPAGFATWEAALTAWGVPEERWNDKNAVSDPDGVGPRIFIQKVPEPKTAKNRAHLDVNVAAGLAGEERIAKIRAEAERVTALGAGVVGEMAELGEFWIVLRDPEGNEFCLQ
ncbi:VOC family protein [Promicromonospora sp. NPDC060204]|uniref:VOC family protein n=1 Tax=Promicromonospora sp. NPDC060204 TaxID=3347071 RepID=UPI00365830F3